MKKHERTLNAKSNRERRTLRVSEWPVADQVAWKEACRPSVRLKAGGSASHLSAETRRDYASRYGLFLGFLKGRGLLDRGAPAAAHVTLANVEAYVSDLKARVSSVTTWNSVSMVRRTAQLLVPSADFVWLAEIDKDLALVAEPRSKLNRLVFTEQLAIAGLTLIMEAKQSKWNAIDRARGVRNGLMVALLSVCPIRRKNFARLELEITIKKIRGQWWIILPAKSTKNRRADERPIARWLTPYIELYLSEFRPLLLRSESKALWISSNTGRAMTMPKVGSVITTSTLQILGIAISPHLFRTADATVAAVSRPDLPHLASALLGHSNPRTTDEHYNRGGSSEAARIYTDLVQEHYSRPRSVASPVGDSVRVG